MSLPTQFVLTPQDKASAAWQRIKAYMEQERQTLRCKNDQPLTEMQTASIRGEIRRLSALIDLDKDRPIPEVPDQY